MQVDPIKPTLKAPGTKRLKLKCDTLRSRFASKSNLCRSCEGVGYVLGKKLKLNIFAVRMLLINRWGWDPTVYA